MISLDEKQKIIADFSALLEEVQNIETGTDLESGPDLYTLLRELIALKTEVKQESRQVKTALESFKAVFSTLEQSQASLSQELTWRRQEHQIELQNQKKALFKPFLLELLEIRDRLAASITHLSAYRPFWKRLHKREISWIESAKEGQLMTLHRFDQILQRYTVKPMIVLEQYFDPIFMKGVESVRLLDLADGIVVKELRQGFLWGENDSVLRLAEVVVNKL